MLLIFNSLYFSIYSQELGYVTGVNRLGIEPNSFQPIFGFSLGTKWTKNFEFETNLYYSQRTINGVTQADYISFAAFPKIGFFTQKAGIYYAPGIALNPTLYHSNIKNHTYLSTVQAFGGQISLGKKLFLDLKLAYNKGLTGAYFDNGKYRYYNGLEVLAGIKCRFD